MLPRIGVIRRKGYVTRDLVRVSIQAVVDRLDQDAARCPAGDRRRELPPDVGRLVLDVPLDVVRVRAAGVRVVAEWAAGAEEGAFLGGVLHRHVRVEQAPEVDRRRQEQQHHGRMIANSTRLWPRLRSRRWISGRDIDGPIPLVPGDPERPSGTLPATLSQRSADEPQQDQTKVLSESAGAGQKERAATEVAALSSRSCRSYLINWTPSWLDVLGVTVKIDPPGPGVHDPPALEATIRPLPLTNGWPGGLSHSFRSLPRCRSSRA